MAGAKCEKPYTSRDKWIIAGLAGLLFLIVSSPYLYSFMDVITSPLGIDIANQNGCPNLGGLILHGLIFILIIRLLMR